MSATMTKKRPTKKRPEEDPDKVVLYTEVPPYIKEQMEELAAEHDRKLTGEVIQALKEYLAKHSRWPRPEEE